MEGQFLAKKWWRLNFSWVMALDHWISYDQLRYGLGYTPDYVVYHEVGQTVGQMVLKTTSSPTFGKRTTPCYAMLRPCQVMYTVKEYMQTVTAVDPYWLAELVA